MQISTIGKQQFAFGLRWSDASTKDKAGDLARSANGGSPVLYTAFAKREKGRQCVGWVDVAEVDARGRLYSYAEALARRGSDGIYAASLVLGKPGEGGGKLWYVAIVNGAVVPDTDVIVDQDTGLMAATSLRDTFGLHMYYMGDPAVIGLSSEVSTFDMDCIKGSLGKVRALQRASSGGGSAALLLVAVVALAGVAAWAFWPKGSGANASGEEDPGLAAQQAREAYLASIHGAIDALPADSGWAADAYALARAHLSPALAGWRLNGFTCKPASCVGNYTAESGQARAPSVLRQRFGEGRVRILPDMQSAEVTLPLRTQTMTWTADQILAPLASYPPLADALGRVPMHLQAGLDGQARTDDLAAMNSAPADAAPLIQDTFSLRAATAPEPALVGALAHYFAVDGFVITELVVSGGAGDTPPAWRITFTRVGPRSGDG